MILAFLVVEFGAICALDAYFYRNWSEVKLESMRKNLVAQVDLLSQQAVSLPDSSIKIKLSLPYVFQVVTEDSVVLWDSVETDRIQKKITEPYFLLSHALKNPIAKDLIEYDDYYGAFKRNSAKMITIGAISKKSIAHEQSEFIERLFVMSSGVFWGSVFFAVILFYIAGFPLRRLTIAAAPFLEGHMAADLPQSKSGEVAALSQGFANLTNHLQQFQQEGIQKVKIEQEVDIAASLQKSLMPRDHIVTDRFELESYYESALKTGGDYWGYFETKKYLVMYIADATGHGLSSAMITSAARGCFSSLQQLLSEYPEIPALPSFLLRFANQAVLDSAQEELNMTMFIATYSFEEQKLYYASAGHNPAWTINSFQQDSKIKALHSLGPRLGESADFEAPLDQSISFTENDLLFLYTDGLLDCTNAQGEFYGRKRAKKVLFDSFKKNAALPEIKKSIVGQAKKFTQNEPLADDISFTLFRPKRRNS